MDAGPPPAPRRQSPPIPSVSAVPRKETLFGPPPNARPGAYAFPDTEEPTRPGAPRPSDRFDTMARLMANLMPAERSDLLALADAWYRCPADERVLLGALAGKLAG